MVPESAVARRTAALACPGLRLLLLLLLRIWWRAERRLRAGGCGRASPWGGA